MEIDNYNLQDLYKKKITYELTKQFKYKTVMQVPRIKKITINIGIGKASTNKKLISNAVADLTSITGQKPVITKAKKSISNFKIRQGYPIGCKVTIRGYRMWDFLKRLIFIAIPRIRDFRGLNKRSFDGYGNYNIGIREQVIFPEIDYNKVDQIRGLDIAIITTAKSDNEGFALLTAFNFPFRN